MEQPKKYDKNKAGKWLHQSLDTMHAELGQVEKFFEENKIAPTNINITRSKIAHMHEICDSVQSHVRKYDESHQWQDLESACQLLEMWQPAFELNYSEVVSNAKTAGYGKWWDKYSKWWDKTLKHFEN